ncbi:hypothetical protein AB0H83_19310 [Dactylosporangium sp. NPDC050688]|uniref:hypothetical protein n=1 Tax=Dactylosporangium sp. NPDC050688 TaxID=3157217 RepID=UPI00340A0508
MQLRRILLALALSTTVALTAACGDDPAGTSASATASAASAGSSASGTAPAGAANTDAVCKGVVAAYDKEKAELLGALGELLAAGAKDDKAGVAAAKAKGQVVIDRLAKAVDAELAKATDPAAKAALQKFVASFAKVLQGDNLDDPTFEAEMDKATAEAAKYCPALAG